MTGRYRYTKWRWRIAVRLLDAAGGLAMRAWRLLRPPALPPEPRRILVVQLDHMGDAILSSVLFPRLKAAYPQARIDVLASPSNRDVFLADPHIDRVHVAERNWFDRRPGRRALGSAVWRLGRTLKAEGYDLGIDVRGDILSVFVLALAGIPRRVGWIMGGGGFLLTDVAEWVPGRHEVASRLALLDALKILDDEPARVLVHATDDDRLHIAQLYEHAFIQPPARVAARSGLVPARGWHEAAGGDSGEFSPPPPLLTLHLGAGTLAKRWPLPHWRSLIQMFLREGWRVIVVGGPDDSAAAATLDPHPNLRDWTGRLAVTETAALLERSDLFIGSDSGPGHIAASAAIPSVILFSGTNRPRQWRPWSRRTLILRQSVGCRPCHHKVCPLADHPCMTNIRPERVFRSALRWWSRLQRVGASHAA